MAAEHNKTCTVIIIIIIYFFLLVCYFYLGFREKMDKYQKVKVLGKGSFGSAILIKRKTDSALFVVK